jgi:hypothetical protein
MDETRREGRDGQAFLHIASRCCWCRLAALMVGWMSGGQLTSTVIRSTGTSVCRAAVGSTLQPLKYPSHSQVPRYMTNKFVRPGQPRRGCQPRKPCSIPSVFPPPRRACLAVSQTVWSAKKSQQGTGWDQDLVSRPTGDRESLSGCGQDTPDIATLQS